MPARPKSDAGKPVNFFNGKFAGRWYCLTPGCPLSISDYAHHQGRAYCLQCAAADTDADDVGDGVELAAAA